MATLEYLEPLLRRRLAGTLPGIEAQRRFAPMPATRGWTPGPVPAGTRQAAALLLLYPGAAGPALPLTLRHSGLRQHAGQISLPGGASDAGETLAATALREAREEIGIDETAVRILGQLTPVHVLVSGFTLHPIVGLTEARPAFHPAAGEVEQVIEVEIRHLTDASRIRHGTRMREGVVIEYPYFDLFGHHVWGATAMVLGEFICVLQDV